MYWLPSASQRWEPCPRTMNGGSPPTARKARTGEFTPPGIICSARSYNLRDCSSLRAMVPPRPPINIAAGNSGAAGGVTCRCDTGPGPSPKPRDSPKIYNLATILKHTAGTLSLVTYPPNREGPGQLRGLRAVHSFWQPRRTPQGQVVLVVGRSRLPFGRWRAQLSAGEYCRGLLQRSRVERDFRRLRSAAHQQSRLQPRSWACAGGGFRLHLEF